MLFCAKSQLIVDPQNNSQVTDNTVNYQTTVIMETFGDRLRHEMNQRGLRMADVARLSGVTKQQIGRIVNNERYPTGSLNRPSERTVKRIAKAIGWAEDDALLAAGYAPTKAVRKPESIEELVTALESLGIDAPRTIEAFPYDPDGEGFREITERIWLDIQLVVNRLRKGHAQPRLIEMTITDIEEVENERIADIKHG